MHQPRDEIDPATLTAYRETEYIVFDEVEIVLRIGERSQPLEDLLARHGVTSGTFITAYNPRSELLLAAENERRMDQLQIVVREAGYPTIAGVGRHPTAGWPPEPSVLVLGVERAEAERLGHAFEQNAVVWVEKNTSPELLVVKP